MKSRKYRPEISRNRLVSNWALAKSLSPSQRSGLNVGKRLVLVMVLAGLGLTVLLASLSSKNLAAVKSISASQSLRGTERIEQRFTKTSSDCSVEDFSRIASLGSFKESTPTIMEGYVLDTRQAFGGLVSIDYRCNTAQNRDVFRVHLHLIDNSWVVKKISRLPMK